MGKSDKPPRRIADPLLELGVALSHPMKAVDELGDAEYRRVGVALEQVVRALPANRRLRVVLELGRVCLRELLHHVLETPGGSP